MLVILATIIGSITLLYLFPNMTMLFSIVIFVLEMYISVILNSSIDEINNVVIDLKNVKEIVNTETLIEVEVDLGW